MEGANADSDHSMTWEDFFGSTTDLAPALIGIYDSLLEPPTKDEPAVETAKDARTDPPVNAPDINESSTKITETIIYQAKTEVVVETKVIKDPTMIAGSVNLPIATVNKSSLYTLRTKSDKTSDSDEKYDLTCSDPSVMIKNKQRTLRETKTDVTLGTLSPNVQRMISSATETTALKFQKKAPNSSRTSTRHKSNIPLIGATSKISQYSAEISPSVEIYDNTSKVDEKSIKVKPELKVENTEATYDVPKNNRPAIYDVPNNNKTAFESLSLPYIDQSIELSISCNDREFDIKLASKETSPQKTAPLVPPRKSSGASVAKVAKMADTNSLNRNDFKKDSPKKLAKCGPYPEAIGSTGNLKTCSIPEKEVVRLNPPMEVTRPLSMSSIASSSSTSSSGVQNKGGVNSAYLASIESLDDHSDVDLTSTNGSNNFVNSAGILNNSISEERNSGDTPRQHILDEMSGMSQLERVCAEIVQTENVYVEDLRQVVEGYLHVWKRESTFSEADLAELFNNIEHIYHFNRSLCDALNNCKLDATCIARCFVDNTSGFSVYTSYCTGYPRTMEVLAALASKPDSAREFRERQIEMGHLLPLASYLLKPVQRILKYHLLLQNVVKQCASQETEYALLKMTGIAQHIDDMKRRHEHAVRVQEIQSLLYGWSGPDLTTYGELCAEGTFRVFGAKAMRHAFLFDKMLLVTKNREDGILAYKSHIMCNNMMLVESISGAPLSFHVIPWDAPRAQLTLQARSPRHKREWTLLLKRVILENYNAVIPSHARQLVMELGQNKTDDDMLAEKSHNLITQASMRKQLSAPEYLEKRKLDRERRKSFENGIRGRMKKNRKHTLTTSRSERIQDCDCTQFSAEKGIDYTCENCYVDLCSDCEIETNKKSTDKCCRHDNKDLKNKCPECDKTLQYIDSASAEIIEQKPSSCKCSDFQSSQESFGKELGPALHSTRGYHSSDNIVNYTEKAKSKEDLSDSNNLLSSVRNMPKTCLKCEKIKENIEITDTLQTRRSRCPDIERHKIETMRSKSKDDPHRSKLSRIGTWRRKSEPGLQQNTVGIVSKKSQDSDSDRNEPKGCEKIEFECRNCGSNKITRKLRSNDGTIISDSELDGQKRGINSLKPNLEIRMYNTKNIPKKISKIKKNRAKGIRIGSDTTAKFYADFSTDVSTENILHISESNDSINVDKPEATQNSVPVTISKDEDIDEETYKKLIEKTDSFKKNELEKVKYLNKQKVINEGSEAEDQTSEIDGKQKEIVENCESAEQPLEQIISQLLLQNREFQKLLKKQQLRNSAQRRHQRLMKSHSNPEHVILAKSLDPKLKPKYVRQSSETIESKINNEDTSENKEEIDNKVEEDHIYETLRIESRVDESLHTLDTKSKVIQHSHRPKRLPSPPIAPEILPESNKGPESDYVYLSFHQLNKIQNAEGIYDVPVKSPQKVDSCGSSDYYVSMENQGLPNEAVYDSLIDICRRKKDVPNTLPTDYLPMSPDQESPNTPEIWLSRQKEHFNVSRDRKSGSLPRSFQVVTSTSEENNLSTFKCTPNGNNKTYLNRDGKLKSADRPYTIASDQSELSYDDVENYMSESEMLKFNKSSKSETDFAQNISQSTLDLEEEIDRCYKNNFEGTNNLDNNKNESLLDVTRANLNTSMTSSCEILPSDPSDEKSVETENIHPEHKIYKPTSNMLSLKNVLSRFKNRTPTKNEESVINANDQSSPDSFKSSDAKSPTSEKRSALNPRSYSKNLLQRFRNIIGEDHPDANENRSRSPITTHNSVEDPQNNVGKNEIKVVITSTDASPTISTFVNAINNEILSKSVCEHSSMSVSQNERNNLEALSISCDNIAKNQDNSRPMYEKSVSLVTNISSSIGSPSRSNNSSYQSLNKLPIYMQGSKHLGARIAQSDYVDPTTLMSEKSALKNVNVLINKNAVRPDSLFSNSSFVTSSSEGAYLECQKVSSNPTEGKENLSDTTTQINSDESFYEKTFEKIEQVTDEDVFRDSAVYSDQEETDESKIDTSSKTVNKSKVKNDRIRYTASFKSNTTVTATVKEKFTSTMTTINKTNLDKSKTFGDTKTGTVERVKAKIAPPVPAKPKINHIPATNSFHIKQIGTKNNTTNKTVEKSSSSESVNTKTIKRNTNIKQPVLRTESTLNGNKAIENKEPANVKTVENKEVKNETETSVNKFNTNSQSNIQIKRQSFERASLDSATRRIRTNEMSKCAVEPPKITTKSVMERRMEIESLSKCQIAKPSQIKKPAQLEKPKSITTKVASFERSVSDNGSNEISKSNTYKREVRSTGVTPCSSTDKANIPSTRSSISQETDDPKSSWVKQVVNKFQ